MGAPSASAEAPRGASYSREGPPFSEPLRLPPEALMRLGRGLSGKETADGWRRVFSNAQAKRELLHSGVPLCWLSDLFQGALMDRWGPMNSRGPPSVGGPPEEPPA
ncbi:hypothetical protein Emed_005548 [Eimeria media]